MADEMMRDDDPDTVRRIIEQVAPGAKITSGYRTPERNRRVGGAPNSWHTRGTPDQPLAFDIVPPPGMTMKELHRRVGASGLVLEEHLDEGDHVHIAFRADANGPNARAGKGGVTRVSAAQDPDGKAPPKATVTIDGETREGTPDLDMVGKTDDELRAAGYRQDDNGLWYRFGTTQAQAAPVLPPPPEPLDDLYAARQEERANAAIDREIVEDERQQSFMGEARDAAATAGDFVGKGLRELFGATSAWATTTDRLTMDVTKSELDRSMGERFVDNLDDALARSGAGYLRRMMDPDADGFELSDIWHQPEIIEGKPVDWLLDRVLGEDRPYFRSVTDDERFDAPAIAAERARRERYEARAAEDPVSNVGDAAAAIAGQVVGSATSPENWVAPGRSLLAKIFGNAGAAGGTDAVLQGAEIASGVRDGFDPVQTGASAAIGGALPAPHAVVQRVVVARRAQAKAQGLQLDPVMPRQQAEQDGEAASRLIDEMLGREDAAPFRVKAEGQAARVAGIDAEDVAAARTPDNVFDINLARMNTPDDIRNTVAGMADALRDDVDLARRAVRTHEQTINAAGRVDVFESMAKRRVGDAANAETLLAYRYMVNASAEKTLALARSLKTKSMTAAERVAAQYAFRRSLSIHSAIQNEFMGARAEAGRALNAMRIPAGSPATKLRQIDQLMAEMGGRTADDLADVLLEAAENGGDALATVARQGWMARTRDMVQLVRINGLLSGPATVAVNAVGTPMMMSLDLVTRALSPRMARMFGGQSSSQIGEATALVQGYAAGMRDVFRLGPIESLKRIGADGARALRQDGLLRGMAPGLNDAAARLGVPLRSAREEAGALPGQNRPMSAAAWRVNEDSLLGRFLDAVQMTIELPSNALALTDDFWKVVSARGELQAQAVRKALREGLEGDAAAMRIRELVDTPTDDMLQAMERQMSEMTFTRSDGRAEQKLNQLRRMLDDNSGPVGVGSWLLPFVRTPMNLTSLAVRTGPLAPLSARFRNALAEGGAPAETAKAQMAVGTALWSVWMGMALQGDITGAGPTNREQREALMREDEFGNPIWQPYSVRIGGRWWSYQRLDPFGSNLSLIGDLAELLNNEDWNGDRRTDILSVSANAVMALGGAFFDKTMLRGAFEFSSAITSNMPQQAERWLSGQASSIIPFSGLQRTIRRGADPYVRETHDVVTTMRNTVPGLSEGLPPSRDLWGKPRTYVTGLGTGYDAIAPIQTRREGASAIDLEILNNGVSVSMPDRSIMVNGETVSLRTRPDIYSEYVRMAGEPAFEHLNAVAEGRHPDSDFYFGLSDGPGGGKAEYIRTVVSAYRDEARLRIMEMYGTDLTRMAADEIERRQEIRAPL